MIINIPLQINEKLIEEQLSFDYDEKVKDYLINEVTSYITKRYGNYYSKSFESGLDALINKHIQDFIEKNGDKIIELASVELGKRLIRTKKAKELVPEVVAELEDDDNE